MAVYIDRYLRRSRSAEGLVEDWKLKHRNVEFATDIEEMVCECVELSDLCKHAWKTLRERAFHRTTPENIEEAGAVMKQAVSKTLGTFHALEGLVADAENRGCTVKNAGALHKVVQEIDEINGKVDKLFPPLNKELIEESIAAFNRGEYQTIEELIRETQGLGVGAH
jgi:uncharacterized protein Yka (UPF0111/DUF47 family)